MWLDQQRKLVDGETIASTFVLEGTDGSRWGTWPQAFPDIEQSISGILSSLSSELPKGKHSCKLLALDASGQQLSLFPVTISGGSDAATDAAQTILGQRRADALQISNFDKQFQSLRSALDTTAELLVQQSDSYGKLLTQFQKIEEVSLTQRHDLMKEQGKQDRLNKLTEAALPLFELGMGLIAERFGSLLDERPAENKQLPPSTPTAAAPPTAAPTETTAAAPPTAAPTETTAAAPPTASPSAQIDVPGEVVPESPDVRPSTGEEPSKSLPTGPGASSGELRSHGAGRVARNGRSDSGRAGIAHPKAPTRKSSR